MKLFAVAFIEFFNNELTIEFHKADNWRGAVLMHPKVKEFEGIFSNLDTADPNTLEDYKKTAFDADCMVDVKEVPNA